MSNTIYKKNINQLLLLSVRNSLLVFTYDTSNFPSSISGLKNLTKLKVLNLKTNNFNISALKSLGIVSSLKELYLGTNKLEGSVTLKGML